ncbi:MAG: hypothetical protein EOO11_12420 [Chitinophagaceae bacterium]|nr:MAG: hypothetical protein EOO11_12420 [Chitinophagaceae bacterium]
MRTLLLLCLLPALAACTGGSTATVAKGAAPAPDPVEARLDSLKAAARAGDLVLRLGDDMLSYSIQYLSAKDPSYSHAGFIVERNGSPWVGHIAPGSAGTDTIRYEPIDSFLAPATNIKAGLYRYTLDTAERGRYLGQLALYGRQGVHFDHTYDLRTDSLLYCSELIAKSLAAATENRIRIEGSHVPEKMLPLMYAFFKGQPIEKAEFRTRKYISLDQLYLHPACRPVKVISLRNP